MGLWPEPDKKEWIISRICVEFNCLQMRFLRERNHYDRIL